MFEESGMSFFAEFEIEETRCGEQTVRHRPSNICLHSLHDPQSEAEKIAREWMKSNPCDMLIWGFGLGYIAQALLQYMTEKNRLWIVETHPELSSLAKQAHPNWTIWQDSRVTILATQSLQRLRDFLSAIPATAEVRVHAPSQALLRWEGGELAEVLESITLPLKNYHAQASLLKRQEEANAPYLSRCRPVSELFNLWENEPVLVMGAGPSLLRVLEEITRWPKRPRMIAANGALPILSDWGICPDVAVCIEAHESAWRDIQKSKYTGRLVVFPIVNHDLLREFSGPLYLAFPECKNETSGDTLASGAGTVMAPALDLAAKMGSNPILLAGLDLSWEKGLYASGAMREKSTPRGSVRATAVSGDSLWTSPAFAAFSAGLTRIIENLKTANPHLRIYDIKTSGLRISGATPWAPEKLFQIVSMNETEYSMSSL
jgi:hypothetical protein